MRDLNGAIGAAALGRAEGMSRRDAAAIKHEVVTALERERKANAARVEIAQPGILRGIDAMHVRTTEGMAIVLVAGDGKVPYRTTSQIVESYDGLNVERVLGDDIERHGAPLVCRLDRARAQRTAGVRALLQRHRVLHLHGPPRYPQYYGQLERQNRDHRAVLGPDVLPAHQAQTHLEQARCALNDLWPRRSLGYRTATELWNQRRPIDVNRDELRDEVVEIASRLERNHQLDHELAWRLGVERALQRRGLLHITPGGNC